MKICLIESDLEWCTFKRHGLNIPYHYLPHEIWQAAAQGLPCVSYSSLEAIKKKHQEHLSVTGKCDFLLKLLDKKQLTSFLAHQTSPMENTSKYANSKIVFILN